MQARTPHSSLNLSQWLLLLLAIIRCNPSSSSSTNRRSGNGKANFSPIKELGPSLAASVAGGTVIAVRSPRVPSSFAGKKDAVDANGQTTEGIDDEGCIVLLFRSPDASPRKYGSDGVEEAGASNLTAASVYESPSSGSVDGAIDPKADPSDGSTDDQSRRRDELIPLFDGPVRRRLLPSSSDGSARILHAPTGLLLAAAGFEPDASHLMRVAAGRVLSRASVYDAPIRSGKALDPHRLVREDLSDAMMDAAASEGARPLGAQLLVIGPSAVSKELELYTIDPSGGWRSHVGWGAVVGRGAERVRASVLKSRRNGVDMDDGKVVKRGWKLALERAMISAIDAFEVGEDVSPDQEENKSRLYGAIVVFGLGPGRDRVVSSLHSSSRCAAIHPDVIECMYRDCFLRVRDKRLLVANE